jgi:hypothetical protein
MTALAQQMQNLSLGRSKDLSLVASIREYSGRRKSRQTVQDFFEQIEQYGKTSNWSLNDLVANYHFQIGR